MSWIRKFGPDEATGRLRELYVRIAGPHGQIDNILQVHALRPHTLEGHLALYKSVLHHTANRLPHQLLESVGIYVSLINGCDYCVDHHVAGLARVAGAERAERVKSALERDAPNAVFAERDAALLEYAARLTREPASITEADITALRAAGADDGEILEVNQAAAYFAYANRTVLGLGATSEGEVLGLAPPENEDLRDWRHG